MHNTERNRKRILADDDGNERKNSSTKFNIVNV
jgi:hypothetical protein